MAFLVVVDLHRLVRRRADNAEDLGIFDGREDALGRDQDLLGRFAAGRGPARNQDDVPLAVGPEGVPEEAPDALLLEELFQAGRVAAGVFLDVDADGLGVLLAAEDELDRKSTR